MSGNRPQPVRYRLTFGLDLPADLAAVHTIDPAALDAAQTILGDLAHGRRFFLPEHRASESHNDWTTRKGSPQDSLTPRGVGQWLHAKNRLLDGGRPIELLAQGHYAEVRGAAESFIDGSSV